MQILQHLVRLGFSLRVREEEEEGWVAPWPQALPVADWTQTERAVALETLMSLVALERVAVPSQTCSAA